MKLYRVSFLTQLLVEAEDPNQAINIAKLHQHQEITDLDSVEQINNVTDLFPIEKGILPWRSSDRRNEAEKPVEEILKEKHHGT